MVQAVTNITQLSTFDTIKSVLRADSTLQYKFSDKDFYQFEPNLKSVTFSNVPYIVVEVPDLSTELTVFDHATTLKTFSHNLILVVSYEARDKFVTYANAIISSLEAAESTFEAIGLINLSCDLTSSDVEFLKEKQVIVGIFELSFDGRVTR